MLAVEIGEDGQAGKAALGQLPALLPAQHCFEAIAGADQPERDIGDERGIEAGGGAALVPVVGPFDPAEAAVGQGAEAPAPAKKAPPVAKAAPAAKGANPWD